MMPNQNKTSMVFFCMKKMIVDLQIFTLQKFYIFFSLSLKKGNGNWTMQCFMYIYIKHTNIFNFSLR